jgi:hypothetical protein
MPRSISTRESKTIFRMPPLIEAVEMAKAAAALSLMKGTTLQFNPSFDEDIIERALAEDPERYGAEYLSKWRDDLSTWLSRDLLDAAVDRGVAVRAPIQGINYIAGCDGFGRAQCLIYGGYESPRTRWQDMSAAVRLIRARLWLRLSSSCANINANCFMTEAVSIYHEIIRQNNHARRFGGCGRDCCAHAAISVHQNC